MHSSNSVRILIFAVLSGFLSAFSSHAFEWEYGAGYKEELLYLHSLVNYEYDPDRSMEWDRYVMNGKGIRVSFGSISRTELLHKEDILINQFLGRGWWFRSHLNWYGSRHLDTDIYSQNMEFQKELFGNLYLCASGDVRHKKDEIDAAFGIMKTDGSRERYAQIKICWDDIVYDERNTVHGDTERFPFGVQWLMRYTMGRWILSAEGKVSNGFSRDFLVGRFSEDYYHHEQRMNYSQTGLKYLVTPFSRIEAEVSSYFFRENRLFQMSGWDYTYCNELLWGTVRYITPFWVFDRMRLELHGVRQYSRAWNYKNYRYRRHEFMPAIFLDRMILNHTLELGYFSTLYEWKYHDTTSTGDYRRNDYVDKLELGWTYHFSPASHIRLSVSHVVERKRFGGGNAQYCMFF